VAGLILLLVFVAGYAVQRGSTCAVAGVEQLVADRRPQRFLGFFLAGAVALAVMAAWASLGHDIFGRYRGAGMLALPIIGGAIFGCGALLNGACAFGTVARLGRGDGARLGTLIGILAGFVLASKLGIQSPVTNYASPILGLPGAWVLAGSLAVAGLIWLIAGRDAPSGPEDNGWNPLSALLLIGLINGLLLILSPGWPYTNLLMDLAGSAGMSLAWRGLMTLVFILGAVAGAVITGLYRPHIGDVRRWARCLAAGIMMGIGATLVPGGNDTMLLVGLPLVLPSFVLAYAAMVTTMALIIVLNSTQSGSPAVPA
jgi:hypothetical protein